MKIEKFHIYLADLGNKFGNELGKVRPVIVIQTDLLNRREHVTTIVCPITSRINLNLDILRVHLNSPKTGLTAPSDILLDQIRAIDNLRFKKHLGSISPLESEKIKENLNILILE